MQNKDIYKEPMLMTWGRIRVRVKTFSKDKRLKELVEKYNEDVKWANIEENYFK